MKIALFSGTKTPSLNFSACLFLLFLGMTSCSSLGLETDSTYENKQKEELYKGGSVVSDEGGFDFLNPDTQKKTADGLGIGVNGYLWRATLDTISFMPIASADPFGGIITTDWYAAPETPDERVKLNVFILDRDLRADGVKVSVFRQVRDAGKNWVDAPVAAVTSSQLEETILTRARQMRMAQRDLQ